MIVPATRKYLTNLSQLAEGHYYSVDSGMGGSYTVCYLGQNEDDSHTFHNANVNKNLTFFHESVLKNVFVCVPTEKYEQKQYDQEKQDRYIHLYHEQNCPACLAARPRPLLAKLEFHVDVPMSGSDVRPCIRALIHNLKWCSIGSVRIIHVEPKSDFEQVGDIARSVNNTMIGQYEDADLKALPGSYEIGTGVFKGELVLFDAVEINPHRGERTALEKKNL